MERALTERRFHSVEQRANSVDNLCGLGCTPFPDPAVFTLRA